MYIFSVFGVGFYHFRLWPFHIPLWCAGHLVQAKVKSPKVRKVWLCVLTAGLLLCEVLCRWFLFGYDTLPAVIVVLIIWDLIFGYFAKPAWNLLRKLFRMFIDWINCNEENDSSE